MKTTNPFTKVDTVIVRVPDLEKARKWYEGRLGLQASFTDEKERIVVFKTGGETSFTIWELKPGEKKATGKTPSSFPIFYAPDIVKAHKELKERGVSVGPVQGSLAKHGGSSSLTYTRIYWKRATTRRKRL